MGLSPSLFLFTVFSAASFYTHNSQTKRVVCDNGVLLPGGGAGLVHVQEVPVVLQIWLSMLSVPLSVRLFCRMNSPQSHGYHLIQAMRLAVEEVNNSSRLLPSVTLGYEIYDTCSLSATIHATLSLLAQGGGRGPHQPHITIAANYTSYLPQVVAAIGPDNSEYAIVTASLLGIFCMPEISYEASSAVLSLKRSYPSFLRTIPSDRVQADALTRLLQAFRWTWVSLVSSDNNYGDQGHQMLYEAAAGVGICFAYQGVIPEDQDVGSAELAGIVQAVVRSRANVTLLFASKHSILPFLREAVRQNVSGKVWLGTEDWTLSTEVRSIPGVHRIGIVMGMSLRHARVPGVEALKAFQTASARPGGAASCQNCKEACSQGSSASFRLWERRDPSPYDMQSASNVYAAVYALAHGLHRLLGCQARACRKDVVYPWQLLQEVKRVNFSLGQRRVYFDANGDPLEGYDLVLWTWTGGAWNYSVVGSYDRNPDRLRISRDKLALEAGQVRQRVIPASVCSKECEDGEQKVPHGTHPCCFHCVACPPGTFKNTSDLYACQKCREDQWSPGGSKACFDRTTVFLSWDDNLPLALVLTSTLLLLLVVGTVGVFLKNLETPVVKSAGGGLCFAILGSLACACLSLYCFFGIPNRVTCLLRVPVYNVSLSICFACMLARAVQIVLVFKMASKAPGLFGAWRKHHGPSLLIGAITGLQKAMALAYLVISVPAPHKEYNVSDQLIFLGCTQDVTALSICMTVYNSLLGLACFSISYMGKDLPKGYNEAKCITFSLLIYFVSMITYLTVLRIYQGKYLLAIYVASLLFTLSGVFGSYFAPKVYVILFRPKKNTNEYFQMSIQSYTKRSNTDE
uniref:Taste 1 receptor member 1 n=1 Tax=Salvator merianae TaxID=96440 RepID=A0A8D0B3S9_SALMN